MSAEEASVMEQELAEVVSKVISSKISAKEVAATAEVSKTKKVQELEQRLQQSTAEVEELKVLKLALEKRVDNLSASTLGDNKKLTAEISSLKESLKSKTDELMAMKSTQMQSSDNISSEVQVLEEENIELMAENKELRIEISKLKSLVGTSSSTSSLPISVPSYAATNSPKNTRTSAAVPNTEEKKRTFGTNLSNVAIDGNARSSGVEKPLATSGVKRPLEVRPAGEDTAATAGATKTRRTRAKAQAIVNSADIQSEEAPAECSQQ